MRGEGDRPHQAPVRSRAEGDRPSKRASSATRQVTKPSDGCADLCPGQGFGVRGLLRSPVLGPKGNVEFLAWLGVGDAGEIDLACPGADESARILIARFPCSFLRIDIFGVYNFITDCKPGLLSAIKQF